MRARAIDPNDARGSSEQPGRQHRVALALGVLWLLDGLLQLQPAQFAGGLPAAVTENAMAQPRAVSSLLLRAGAVAAHEPVLANLAVALVQLGLGALLCSRRTVRVALWASIPWALCIWALGEGFGGLLTGFAMSATGAPGAALLYALVAACLLRSDGTVWLRRAWAGCWLLGAVLQVAPATMAALRLRASFEEAGLGEPAALGAIDHRLAGVLGGHALIATGALVILDCALALAIYLPDAAARRVLTAVLVALGAFWVAGEDLGGLLTGAASDVGAMPLNALVLFAVGPRRAGALASSRRLTDSAQA